MDRGHAGELAGRSRNVKTPAAQIRLSFPHPLLTHGIMKQASRESIIELLFLSLYLDDHLSLAEDEVLTSALDAIGWESSQPREMCIFNSFSKAREAASCGIKTEEFLASRADVIKGAGDAATAITWLSKVLGADGISPSEARFLEKLEKRLFA
jgi:hypothetical protein